jgi:hypothetical protein
MRRAAALLLALALSGAAASADTMAVQVDYTPFHATPDVIDFVLGIAAPTAQAPGERSGDRVVTIGWNDKQALVVTSMQLVADGNVPNFPVGTVAVMIVRRAGECQPPHGKIDGIAMGKRIFSFFVDYRGQTIWELGAKRGFYTFWQVNGANDVGPDESFNIDPEKYKVYPCAKYE